MLRDAERRSLLGADALSMIEGALHVTDMRVREVMVPRKQMVVIRKAKKPDEFVEKVAGSGHSRFPVIGDSKDDVVGILLAKDLLSFFADRQINRFELKDVMRPAVFNPESKRLDVLLREFRASRNHMSIVVDEYGGVSGLVTIEDVLEQIVGDIDDEHDHEDEGYFKRWPDGQHTVKALAPIDDFNEHFRTTFSIDDFDTIGGLVVRNFGRLPNRGEQCEIDGIKFEIVRADKRRVHLLRVMAAKGRKSKRTGE